MSSNSVHRNTNIPPSPNVPPQLSMPSQGPGIPSVMHQPHAPHPYSPYPPPPQQQHPQAHQAPPPHSPSNTRKRRLSEDGNLGLGVPYPPPPQAGIYPEPDSLGVHNPGDQDLAPQQQQPPPPQQPVAKKSRVNTPWSAVEEQKLKVMRDAGNSWSEIAKSFPHRTEGSVKKHWYKDMHYAEFSEDEPQTLLTAIKEYEAAKWKAIGAKIGKPAKACEQYAREHFTKEQIAGKS